MIFFYLLRQNITLCNFCFNRFIIVLQILVAQILVQNLIESRVITVFRSLSKYFDYLFSHIFIFGYNLF